MIRRGRLILLAMLALGQGATVDSVLTARSRPDLPQDGTRKLSFQERVQAQAAIERVYYSHRIGAVRPFEDAVPRGLLERKVRTYLAQSVALESIWKSPITAAALRREMERIAADTRFPDRLSEIYRALGDDSFLIQETFARAALADRLVRSYHPDAAAGGQTYEAWWQETEPRLDPALAHEVALNLAELPEPGRIQSTGSVSVTAGPADPCTLQDIWSGGGTNGPPDPRRRHTAVWTGSEMIIWGGSGGSSALDTGSRYDPLTDTWHGTTRAGAPEARMDHTAVWTGSEMIVWGGYPGSGGGMTTGGRYDPVADSWTATSLINAPTSRWDHTAVWTGSEMIVWGGRAASAVNTGGRYDPTTDTWTATSDIGAPPLDQHAAVWTGTEMLVWGGLWSPYGGAYTPATDSWRQLPTDGAPSLRMLPSAVWTGTEMVVWGGTGGGFAPGGGRYDPATNKWRPTNQSGAPLNRYQHTAVWTGSRMVIWGGTDSSHQPPNEPVNTGALYDPATDSWTATNLAGAPTPRAQHAAVWTGSVMIVWGAAGDRSGGRYDPSNDSWTPTNSAPGSPSQRKSHTAVWTGSEMIVWGGTADSSGGRYDPLLDNWSPTSLANAPSPRAEHTAVWTGQQMIVWGGESSGELNTGARYDPSSDTWSATTQNGAPSARADHTAVWTGSRMIVWGGVVGDYFTTGTGALYDPALDRWSPTSDVGAPTQRAYHTAVWTGRAMIVWGGDNSGALGTGALYDPTLDRWTPTSPINAPSPRVDHTAVWTGRNMIVWGGAGGGSALNTGASYDPLMNAWSPTSTSGAPFARLQHTAVWTGREMIVWGGSYESGLYVYSTNTGGRYDPAANSWAPTTVVNAPDPRDLHTAVWIGNSMIVRGGELQSGDIIQLARDPYTAWYGNAAAVPSPDADHDGFSICAGDCDDGSAAVYPGAPQICGDHVNNDCSAPGWPSLAGTNEADDDGDGLSECAGDCDDANGAVWGTPGEVTGLELQGAELALLSWSPTTVGGGVRYDTLRSANPNDFVGAATCVESDDPSDVSASDADLPPSRGVFYYLIRAENACPGPLGIGPLGVTPSGTPRQGRACP